MRNPKIKYFKLRIFLRCNYHRNEQAPSKRRFSQISKQNKMNVLIFFASFGNMCTAQYINLNACKKTNCGKLMEDIHSFRWFFVLIWPLHNSFLFAFFIHLEIIVVAAFIISFIFCEFTYVALLQLVCI